MPVLLAPVTDWHCPACGKRDQTAVPVRGHRMHTCPALRMLTAPMLPAGIPEGSYAFGCNVSGYLKVATTSTNDVTLIHTPSIPVYATT